jgi:hypothetical protein
MADTVVNLTGCTLEEAEKALQLWGDEIWKAVDSLLVKPAVSGDKYIPPKPVINNGLTSEQQERCLKGRDLQNRVNVVFSVAHAQLRSPQDPSESSEQSSKEPSENSAPSQPAETQMS